MLEGFWIDGNLGAVTVEQALKNESITDLYNQEKSFNTQMLEWDKLVLNSMKGTVENEMVSKETKISFEKWE